MPWLNAENPPKAGQGNDTSVAVNPHFIILQGHCQGDHVDAPQQ